MGFNIKKNFVETLKLPKEILLNLPLISITGKEELMIENFKGILEYSTEKIRINTSCGILRIIGKSLFLEQITSECLIIRGIILVIEFIS